MWLSSAVVVLLLLELCFSLTLVGHVTARKSSAGRRKAKKDATAAPFDLQASISGASTMPAVQYITPAATRRGVPRPASDSLPFFPSMLGAANEVSQQQFLTQYWGRKACLVQADQAEHQPRFSLTMADVQTIISDNPQAMVGGVGFKFASNGSILGKSLKGQVVDVNTALDGYSQGATVVINDIGQLWPSLTAHQSKMEDELRLPISANLYLTPEDERGFNPHYDMDDTFILQLEGTKEWVVWEAGGWPGEDDAVNISPLRDQRAHMHDTPPDTVPRRHFVMQPGDVLYIPRGVSHVAGTTAQSPSLHVTFAVHALCWEHFMRFLFAPGGAADPTRAPFQLNHHDWAVEANDALPGMPPLPGAEAPLASSLKAHFVNCKASKTGGQREISTGMALQWWLHDVALAEPDLRSTFSWYWTWTDGGVDNAPATRIGKQKFLELIVLLRDRLDQLDSLSQRRMRTLGCSKPSDKKILQARSAAVDVLAAAEERADEYVYPLLLLHL